MRRTVASDWIAGLVGAALVAALLLAGSQRANLFGALHAGVSLPGLFEAFIDLACPAAMAQEQLEFRPVPAESASRFDRMRVKRGTDREPTEPAQVPPVPKPDDPAEPPIPGHPPGVTLGKSGSVMRIGSDIHVEEDEVIRGDLNTVGGDITIEGHVQGNVVAMRGDVTLTSTARVDGDVVCIGGTLHEESGAVVGGERVTAIGDEKRRRIRRGSSVGAGSDDDDDRDFGDGQKVVASLISLMLGMLVAWVLARFAPGRTAAAAETLRRDTGSSLLTGALIWALVIPSIVALALVVALLCITIIGIPLALAALLGYALFLCVLTIWGYVVGAIFLGGGVMRRQAVAAVAATPGSIPVSPTAENGSQGLLERHALMGVLVLGGAGVIASVFQLAGGPMHALGTMVGVLGKIATLFLITMGAGAWLKSELATGLLGRWWSGRRGRSGYGGAPPAGSPVPPPPPAPAPPGTAWSAASTTPPYAAPPPQAAPPPPAPPPPAPPPTTDPSRFAPPQPPPPTTQT